MMPGCSFKPLRVSSETGHFTVIMRMAKGTTQPTLLHLGASDTYVLSGKLSYASGPLKGSIGPGVWSYSPAGAKMEGVHADEDTEYLATFYGPVAFLDADGRSVKELLTGYDVKTAAQKRGIVLLPNTLKEALQEKPEGHKGAAEPLAMTRDKTSVMNKALNDAVNLELSNPHHVDTNVIPWIVNPDAPDIGLKIMRISTETGTVSAMVRQNGQAPPHYHLGPADFFITSGRIGYRAGPPEGYGPGTYMWEPAGARHEATQRVTDEDLIYTANIYGPIQFDSGVGTPILDVLSWMTYLQAASAFQTPLIASTFPGDHGTLLAKSMH
eukprot:SRR837773.1789.p2 GENE.SRR837773.1789~~SRR837773.1789.p2  ORF type:complete len:326 (-),score=133.48 SRR837773.1789:32-1009(-)